MKNLFKRICSGLLSLGVIVSLSVPVFAMESTIETRIQDGVIVDNQISEEVIENLPEGMIEEIKKDEGTIVSVTTQYVDFSEGVQTFAVMPTSDFKLTVVSTRISEKAGKDNFKFVACGEWLVNPIYEFTDCIGISWSDEFTLYSDYGYAYTAGSIPKYDYDVATRNEVVAEAGVAYDIDLKLFDRQDEIYLIAKVYKDNSSGSANVVASYGHVIIKASGVDVSISSGKEIGMSVGFASGIEMASPDYDSFDY